MQEAPLVACIVQALLGGYVGVVLWRGAVTPSRRLLSRALFECGAYAGVLAIYHATSVLRDVTQDLSIALAALGTVDLFAFGIWQARGSDPASVRLMPWPVYAAACAFLGSFVLVQAVGRGTAFPWPWTVLTAATALGLLGAICAFAVAWRRGVKGGRAYLLGAVWPLVPLVVNLVGAAGVEISIPAYRLVRDLCVLAFEFGLLTAYLNHGDEPMSLRDRIVSGVLMAVASLTVAFARLVLPLVPEAPPGTPFVDAHLGALRLVSIIAVTAVFVAVAVPLLFRTSVLGPVERLTAGLARAETGERFELPVERRDELGTVARSFNKMVSALAEGRDALAEKVHQLEARQSEIATLNDELRRQIAARSRQLAEALRSATLPVQSIAPGHVLDDRYLVSEQLGSGGMGKVYGAKRLVDGRELALKVITGGTPEDAVRFMQEAEIAATLHHENLLSVLDVGLHAGTPYFVMERLHGGSLADATARFGDADYLVPVLVQVARGLEELHARSVLHRDLKPANVLLTGAVDRPVAKIADFGIASIAAVSELGATMPVGADLGGQSTAPGLVMGTVAYLAPELAHGAKGYGTRSDVYAFGVLAWEVLSGKVPYAVPALLLAMSGGVPPPLVTDAVKAPAAIRELLVRCLSPEPDKRPSVPEILRVLMLSG